MADKLGKLIKHPSGAYLPMTANSALILAAGKGTRMKSEKAKVLHEILGRPMLFWPVEAAREAGAKDIVIVTGHQSDQVISLLEGMPATRSAIQEEQLGTGHAVSCAIPELEGISGSLIILCGDTPLLRGDTLARLAETHRKSGAAITVLTAVLEKPFGYGRIIRGSDNRVKRIVEQKDATFEEAEVKEINSGIYCMDMEFIRRHIGSLGSDNAQSEYYLTDLVGIAVAEHLICEAVIAEDPAEIMGVNDREQLADATGILRRRINSRLMKDGVTIIDPECTYIEAGVRIGNDTVVWPGAIIRGNTRIGRSCVIDSGVNINNCSIEDNVHIKSGSVLEDARISSHVSVGPMAHLRPGTVLHPHVKIGNFVETKKAVMGEGSKASHLTYLGDAEIGRDVNIGCGTITCNYDGKNKHRTIIGDDVFIGSDVQLVAPVTVGRNSLVAAGTTVTADVPPDSLAISRTPQLNKEGWRLRKRNG